MNHLNGLLAYCSFFLVNINCLPTLLQTIVYKFNHIWAVTVKAHDLSDLKFYVLLLSKKYLKLGKGCLR